MEPAIIVFDGDPMAMVTPGAFCKESTKLARARGTVLRPP
jgi:hypothetical protein